MSRPVPAAARRRAPRAHRRALVGLTTVVLLAPAAASASATTGSSATGPGGSASATTAPASPPRFTAPRTLQGPGATYVSAPALDVAPSGAVALAWGQRSAHRRYEIVVRRGTSAGRFGRIGRVTGDGSVASVAAGPSGGAGVLWEQDGAHGGRRLEVAVARGRGRFGAAHRLTTVRASVTSARVLAAGDRYVAVWWQGVPATGDHAVRYAVSDARGRFGSARTLTTDTGVETDASAAVTPDGTVVAAWGTPGTAEVSEQVAYARLLPGTERFEAPRAVAELTANPRAEALGIRVVGGPAGTALTWTQAQTGPELLRTAPIAADGTAAPATVLALESTDLSVHSADGLTLASPVTGAPGLGAWTVTDQAGDDANEIVGQHVFAAVCLPDGTYGAPTPVEPGTDAALPAAAATRRTAVLTWRTGTPTGRHGLRYAVERADGTLGASRTLGSRVPGGALLASSDDAVVAAWTTNLQRSRTHPAARQRLSVAFLRDH